eukprot:TRINITY_DN2108_c0_g1_i2.p1 TRINITY_DN2108_c0_g1~~TRINITY_DN2108_c0_g1_i2.p1  ORF type:complete len:247 (-),score=36.80 TRINITY_DN2108_c0_g1_i2:57-734(-)
MAEAASATPVKFTYFPVWAKGPAIALALELSGMEWEGAFPDWKAMKATTPWLELPVLEVPGYGMIGQEMAILNFIARQVPAMGGLSEGDWLASQQLLGQAEDIYLRLGLIKNGRLSAEEIEKFWTNDDLTSHNRDFGIKAFLSCLENFYNKCGVGNGQFTATGTTVGECKLFASLHSCKLIHADVLTAFPGLVAFYDTFLALPATQALITTGGRMPGTFNKYFSA